MRILSLKNSHFHSDIYSFYFVSFLLITLILFNDPPKHFVGLPLLENTHTKTMFTRQHINNHIEAKDNKSVFTLYQFK